MRYTKDFIEKGSEDLNIENWWKELLNQDEGFDFPDITSDMILDGTKIEGFNHEKVFEPGKGIPFGDDYAAEAIREKFGKRLTYVSETGMYYFWNGLIHMPTNNSVAFGLVVNMFYRSVENAMEYLNRVLRCEVNYRKKTAPTKQAAQEADKWYKQVWTKDLIKQRKYRESLRKSSNLNAIVSELKKACSVAPDYYSDDTRWFVCRNGVFDMDELRMTGELSRMYEHSPDRNVTRWFDADYEPGKNLGHWDKFLEESLDEEDVREFLQAAIGAGFSGNTKLRAYLILMGVGSSGKSTILETFDSLASGGSGYAIGNAGGDTLIRQKNGGKSFGRAQFANRRFVGVSEPDVHSQLDSEFVKMYTGDREFQAEEKHKNAEKSLTQGLLLLATNSMPKIDVSDSAILDRTKIIRFKYQFVSKVEGIDSKLSGGSILKPNQKLGDPALSTKLLDDRSRILEWVLEGMLMFYNEVKNLETNAPASIEAEMVQYKLSAQTPIRFVEELLSTQNPPLKYAEDDEVPKRQLVLFSDLYNVYITYMKFNHETPMGKQKFNTMVREYYGTYSPGIPESERGRVSSGGYRFQHLALIDSGQRLEEMKRDWEQRTAKTK